ncbi:fungal chitosanase of glycosyl hydrolase group 75-domain-containing protein [Aspergillus carlsbadensis]|nr:fungal chitosanase of glycosyl hydrolase group 75-domain-containing protein [Aspergillus carlsbadensis]
MHFSRLSHFLFAFVAIAKATVAPPSFAASDTIPVAALNRAVDGMRKVPPLATYPVSIKDNSALSTIHSDWASFQEGAAFIFRADMDIDCDGINFQCDGNLDGQPLTNWGALSAYEVPFIVIPNRFLEANPAATPGNNVAAVICNNQMYYGILGDTNHNDPQVTGEASWLLSRTCFPDADLNGNRGHDEPDVTYILFAGEQAVLPETAHNDKFITDFDTLRSMGDNLVTSLLGNLGIPLLAPGSQPNDTQGGSDSDSHPGTELDSASSKRLPCAPLALFMFFLAGLAT